MAYRQHGSSVKKNKNSYRPITRMSCLGKIYASLLKFGERIYSIELEIKNTQNVVKYV